MSTQCADFHELLSALLDGELAGDERARVEAHAAACAGCRRMLERFRRVDAAAAELPAPPPVPAGRWDRMLGEIRRAGRVREAAVLRPAPARARRSLVFALAAAAALALAASLFALHGARDGHRRPDGGHGGHGGRRAPEYCSAEVVVEPSDGESQTLVLAAPEGGLSLVIVSSAAGPDSFGTRAGG